MRMTAPQGIAKSTVPQSLTRAETAAEDVIGFLEKGQLAKSHAEARILHRLAHGPAAAALRQNGVTVALIGEFQRRADKATRLSLANAPALEVSQAANDVSQLMPGFYARFKDPVPSKVLTLDYLDRQVQLDVWAHDKARLADTVRQLDATWQTVRPLLVNAGGVAVAKRYDLHLSALKQGGAASMLRKESVNGLDLVDKMEGVFLGQ